MMVLLARCVSGRGLHIDFFVLVGCACQHVVVFRTCCDSGLETTSQNNLSHEIP
jgi:hypothetical protein